jgi:hypothetical protein
MTQPDTATLKTNDDVLDALRVRCTKTIPDSLCNLLCKYELVQYVLDGVPGAWSQLEEEVEEWFGVATDIYEANSSEASYSTGQKQSTLPPTPRRVQQSEVAPLLEEHERERARVRSEYLAVQAGRDPDVERFRREILGGRTLTTDEAYSLLTSEPAAFLSQAAFAEHGIPILGHQARRLRAGAGGALVERVWHIEWTDGSCEAACSCEPVRQVGPGHIRREPLSFPTPQGGKHLVVVYPGAVLDELREIGEDLARRYGWPIARATWFVLTREAPWVAPIRSDIDQSYHGDHISCRIVVSSEPWVRANTQNRFFRDAQQAVLGKENRSLARRSLELFRFVILEHALTGNWPGWREVMRRWNKRHRDWARRDERNFAREVGRIMDTLVYPTYAWPPSEEVEAPPEIARLMDERRKQIQSNTR